jgi:putative transcriptional regulator
MKLPQRFISQARLASKPCASLTLWRSRRIGEKKPSGPSLKLLNLIDKKGVDALV